MYSAVSSNFVADFGNVPPKSGSVIHNNFFVKATTLAGGKMVRGITSSTVVPTASDDYVEGIPSRHSHTFISDNNERAEYSSDGEKTNVLVSSVAELQSDQYFRAAFNRRATEAKFDEHSSTIAKNPHAGTSSPTTTNGTKGAPKQSNSISAQEKSIAPSIGKSLRQRSKSVVVQKQEGVELTKNYLELVQDFRQLRPFTRRTDGKYPPDTLCIYCAKTRPTSVFFPCQHMCVCNDCIVLNNISTDYTSATNWCACPVCMADIRLILPHSGKEEEFYWKWVLEIKLPLPLNFKEEFKEAGKRLNKNATPTRGRRRSIATVFRREPIPQKETSNGPSSNPVLGRCHSWQPGEVANVHNVAASNEQEEAHICSIL